MTLRVLWVMAMGRRERDRIHALDVANSVARALFDKHQRTDYERFIKTGSGDKPARSPLDQLLIEIPAGSAAERDMQRLEAYWNANPRMRGKYVMPGDN